MDKSPYLSGIPPLPEDVLALLDSDTSPTPAQWRRIRRLIRSRMAKIRAARCAYEAAHGPVYVEPPSETL